MVNHSSILLGKFHEQRSLVGYSPWVTESDMTVHLSTHVHLMSFSLQSQIFKTPSWAQPNILNRALYSASQDFPDGPAVKTLQVFPCGTMVKTLVLPLQGQAWA